MVYSLSLVLFAGACVGHAALMVACHNWLYGLNLPHWCGKFIHLVFGLATASGPIVWLCWFGPDVLAWLDQRRQQSLGMGPRGVSRPVLAGRLRGAALGNGPPTAAPALPGGIGCPVDRRGRG